MITETPFHSADQEQEFRKNVLQYFADRNEPSVHFEGWYLSRFAPEDGKLGLWNIAQTCSQIPEEEWSDVIKDHFDKSLRMTTEGVEYEANKADFDLIRKLLRLQLYPSDFLEQIDVKEEVVSRTDIPGTLSVIVVDLPSSIQTLRRSDTVGWNKGDDEIFLAALNNTLAETKVEMQAQDAGDVKIYLLAGEDILSAVSVLNLQRHPELVGTHGALVSIPTRHFVLSIPINDLEIVKGVQVLGPAVQGMNQAGPGSLSPYLYWYKDGNFEIQPLSIEGNQVNFSPTEAFLKELNNLSY